MPFTPYHFGPSGFFGLLFRRWIDVPVFVAANILIDLEVLADQRFDPGWPVHQIWHFHTLLIGGLAGAVFGLVIYSIKPLRWLCEISMKGIGLPYKAAVNKMVLAGLFGACFHVLIDSFYHYDVQIFWPYEKNVLLTWIREFGRFRTDSIQNSVKIFCMVFWGLFIVLYFCRLLQNNKSGKNKSRCQLDSTRK